MTLAHEVRNEMAADEAPGAAHHDQAFSIHLHFISACASGEAELHSLISRVGLEPQKNALGVLDHAPSPSAIHIGAGARAGAIRQDVDH